ncbi:hypothetical protein AAF712_004572 [Marasmius tenuissimus]|uniref:Uncharacterized protein n=1 Tax=Marasmius tenuissimus TaxID=585030 RepID=A0ABR3A540_9AGAR
MILTREQFQQEQLAGVPPAVEGVLDGQVVVITGANTGLGFEAAKHFAILCHRVQDEKKDRKALNRIKTETGFQNVELWIVDLNSFESIVAIKDKINQLKRLDVLVENAVGTTIPGNCEEISQDHSPNVSVLSDGHYWASIPLTEALDAPNSLEFLNDKSYFDRNVEYHEAKTLDVMFIRALQQHLPDVATCSVNPAFCYIELGRDAEGHCAEHLQGMRAKLAFTTEEGSRQLLFAAIGRRDQEAEVRGSYLSFSWVSECSDLILSDDGQKLEQKLWTEILEVLGKVDGTAEEIIQRYLS